MTEEKEEVQAFEITGIANLGHAYSCNKCGAVVLDENRQLHKDGLHKTWKATV